MMTSTELCEKLVDIAKYKKSLYVMGCFGAPLNDNNKRRYTNNHSYNKKSARTKMINAASPDTFGFDCVGLIKAILWGWNGSTSKSYGGAVYCSNNVPDINADSMILKCDSSTDFSKIIPGALVWMKGHVGIYVGNGHVVECSPKWKNGVQISMLGNNPLFKAGNYRTWTKWGKLPYIKYEAIKSITDIAKEVIAGKWGNGVDRKKRLETAGYDYNVVQLMVNDLLKR